MKEGFRFSSSPGLTRGSRPCGAQRVDPRVKPGDDDFSRMVFQTQTNTLSGKRIAEPTHEP
jgi:hypothetical protein